MNQQKKITSKIWKKLPISVLRYILQEYKPLSFYKRIYNKSVYDLINKFSHEYIEYKCNYCNSEYRGKKIRSNKDNVFIYFVDENNKNNICTSLSHNKKFSMLAKTGQHYKVCNFCIPDLYL